MSWSQPRSSTFHVYYTVARNGTERREIHAIRGRLGCDLYNPCDRCDSFSAGLSTDCNFGHPTCFSGPRGRRFNSCHPDSVQIQPCNRCSAPAFDPQSVETNRGGLCEPCFLTDLRAELAKCEAAEQQAIAAQDDRMKRLGMLVRISAWIHPDDGDDHPLDVYLPYRPTAAQVRTLLREAESIVSDDFEVIDL